MIVVDSSVWISTLRNEDVAAVRKFRAIDDNNLVLVGDLILLELLQGARDDTHASRLERNLRQFEIVTMLDARLAVRAAQNFRTLRSRGITLRKTIELIIATFCLAHGYALLHQDRDFDPLVEHLGLLVL
jgi:predicted nucleic acid-binding protein